MQMEVDVRTRIEALGLLSLPFALAVLTGDPLAADLGRVPSAAEDPTAPLVTLLGLLAWACTGWLVLLALMSAAGPRLEGVARWLAPASVRSLVRVAVGATAVSVLAAAPALAQGPAPQPTVSAPDATPALDLDWPSEAHQEAALRTPVPQPGQTRPGAAAEVVVVRAGDCLWRLAARQLGPGAGVREVAQSWPQWWSANRAAIGADPDLIYPGAVLHAPHASLPTTQGEP